MDKTSSTQDDNLNYKKLYELMKEVLENLNSNIGGWVIKKRAMAILDYGDTKFYEFVKDGKLEIRKIGNRIFVKFDSIIKLIESGSPNL